MREIGQIIVAALAPATSDDELDELARRSRAIGERFPLYPGIAAGFAPVA